MIENGIIKVDNIYGVPFKVDLIPKSNKSSRPGLPMVPTSITIHETDNEDETADARSHTEYVDKTRNYVSWDFTVDDTIIIQELPINENAWHAGDGPKGKGNRSSIAIEICVNKGGDFEQAKRNAFALMTYLVKNVKSIIVIEPHKTWNGKNCPRRILAAGWNNFMKDFYEYKATKDKKVYPVPMWAAKSFSWAVDIGANDGIVQSPEEIQFTHMLYKYHQAVKEGTVAKHDEYTKEIEKLVAEGKTDEASIGFKEWLEARK